MVKTVARAKGKAKGKGEKVAENDVKIIVKP